MTLKQIASLGKELVAFLRLFVGRFLSHPGFNLLSVYVQGLLSNLKRKNIEAMTLLLATAPRNLQRFVERLDQKAAGTPQRPVAAAGPQKALPSSRKYRFRFFR